MPIVWHTQVYMQSEAGMVKIGTVVNVYEDEGHLVSWSARHERCFELVLGSFFG